MFLYKWPIQTEKFGLIIHLATLILCHLKSKLCRKAFSLFWLSWNDEWKREKAPFFQSISVRVSLSLSLSRFLSWFLPSFLSLSLFPVLSSSHHYPFMVGSLLLYKPFFIYIVFNFLITNGIILLFYFVERTKEYLNSNVSGWSRFGLVSDMKNRYLRLSLF